MIKDILVHVNNAEQDNPTLEAAIYLTQRFNAHLKGVHVSSLLDYAAAKDIFVAGLWEECKEDLRIAAKTAQERYKAAITRAGLSGEWHHVDGDPATTIIAQGRVVDLIVLGQPMDDPWPIARNIADKVPLAAGRPVLFVPSAGFAGSLGKSVLIAWNDSREAARAVNDALPLLTQAEQVIVMAVDPPPAKSNEDSIPCADIALHLARHGVEAAATQDTASANFVGEVLRKQAERQHADLIVTGAYGHSRLKEIVLGGVTRYMLKHATVPVLMSH
jgi:nucleotide-binding universal stress UspA family protein